MAPRANWKGYLRLSLVSCPIALYPVSSLSEKVSFNRINRKTGNRLKQQNVDAEPASSPRGTLLDDGRPSNKLSRASTYGNSSDKRAPLLRARSRVLTPALRYYAVAIGMISGGLGLIGLAQALRLLAEILTTGAAVDGH